MKKTLSTIVATLVFAVSYSQKTEISLSFNSGLFSFSGLFAKSASQINYSGDRPDISYTNNPYGSESGLSGGISGNLKWITKERIVVGFDLGYELLRSKIAIDQVWVSSINSNQSIDAKGKTFLNHNFLNLHPFTGYRFLVKNINIDVTGGFDIGYCFSAKEKGEATGSDMEEYKTDIKRSTINFDIRPRLQLAAGYKSYGAYFGYSWGIENYVGSYIGAKAPACYSRLLRFGLTYKLR